MSTHKRLAFWVMLAALTFFHAIAGEPAPKGTPTEAPKTTTTTTEATQKEEASKESPQASVQERVQVVGSTDRARDTPGSAHFISKRELELFQYGDIHRVLRSVPGINIQEEEGYGLRPNIGMRGTGVERSQKITLMEDGVLVAPAPYTAPAAYYFPTAGRMESIEILKGSSSVKQGPYTNGGALNLISSSIPSTFSGDIAAAGGSDELKRLRANVGGTHGRLGWLVETFQLDTDGFKNLDNGGDTGVELNDYLGKLRYESGTGARFYQSLELKVGKTEQFGNETYLGLTQADFEANPYRRYVGSQEDFIDTDHEQFQLRHYVQPFSNFDITTTLYRNNFARNWHKVESTGGISNGSLLANPEANPLLVQLLRGEIDSNDSRLENGALLIRNNNREYYSQGVQTVFNWQKTAGKAFHELEWGIRFHQDEEDRFQNDETWGVFGGTLTQLGVGAPGSQSNRVSDASALSAYITDTIRIGSWSLRPGVRFESIDYTREDYSTTDPLRSQGPTRLRENDERILLPGMGATYFLNEENRLFLGVHKGFSPPGAGQNDQTESEESFNYELGYRHFSSQLTAEIVGFFNDYDNLLGTETVSGGGDTAGDLFNGGEVNVYGLEASLGYRFNQGANWTLPFHINYTFTDSEFQTSFETDFADWSPFVTKGDTLPYIPKSQFTANLGLDYASWNFGLTGNFVDEMRTTSGSGSIPDAQRIDDHFVLDLAANYTFLKSYKAFVQVRNLADETYVVSRRPYGLRPGLDRSFIMGLSAKF